MKSYTNASTIIDRNWEQVKSEIQKAWNKLTHEEVSAIKNYNDLVNQLMKTYNITEEEVVAKINDFIHKLGLIPNFSRLQELKEVLYESAVDAKEKIGKSLKKSVDHLQEKTADAQVVISKYVKKNPLKIIGLGILTTIAIKKLWPRQKS